MTTTDDSRVNIEQSASGRWTSRVLQFMICPLDFSKCLYKKSVLQQTKPKRVLKAKVCCRVNIGNNIKFPNFPIHLLPVNISDHLSHLSSILEQFSSWNDLWRYIHGQKLRRSDCTDWIWLGQLRNKLTTLKAKQVLNSAKWVNDRPVQSVELLAWLYKNVGHDLIVFYSCS